MRQPVKFAPFVIAIAVVAQTTPLKAPFQLEPAFVPSGWMGDGKQGTKYLSLNSIFRGHARPQDTDGLCIRLQYYRGPEGWAAIYWQYPDGNWGEQAGRRITGATRVSFWASGETGREVVEFKAGGIRGKYRDTFEVSLGRITLSQQWKAYTIDLKGADTSSVIGAFCVVLVSDPLSPKAIIYLDDIRYE